MSNKRPLVVDFAVGGPQQLQPADDLDIPINDRVTILEQKLCDLGSALVAQGIEIPDTMTDDL